MLSFFILLLFFIKPLCSSSLARRSSQVRSWISTGLLLPPWEPQHQVNRQMSSLPHFSSQCLSSLRRIIFTIHLNNENIGQRRNSSPPLLRLAFNSVYLICYLSNDYSVSFFGHHFVNREKCLGQSHVFQNWTLGCMHGHLTSVKLFDLVAVGAQWWYFKTFMEHRNRFRQPMPPGGPVRQPYF